MLSSLKKMVSHSFLTCLLIDCSLQCLSAEAQDKNTSGARKAVTNSSSKPDFKFEVLSIRPVGPGASPYGLGSLPGLTPVGYTANLMLGLMVQLAYTPWRIEDPSHAGVVPILNLPDWTREWYVINGRIAAGDTEAWRNQSIRHELLSSALQAALKERCKLVVHEDSTELPDYKLVIGKKGAKLKPANPAAKPTNNYRIMKLENGGAVFNDGENIARFYGATMGDLAWFLSIASGFIPVHDTTGLNGRYDFTLKKADVSINRFGEEAMYNWSVHQFGLNVKPGKYSAYKIVVDHIEKPSAN